jgi:6-phosphogluconolactonase
MTRPRVHRYVDTAALFDAAAARVVSAAAQAAGARGVCRLALAGGSTPRGLYTLLASPPWRDRIDWTRVHAFWGDERCVPPDHPESNFRMAHEALLVRVPIPPTQVHRIRGELDPARAAAEYAALLGEAPLDLVLLGLGVDGHTASLFPDTPGLRTETRNVIATRGPIAPFGRISLTLRVFQAARGVVFLVTGRDKAHPVAEVLGQIEAGCPVLPAALVQPRDGSWEWLLDEDAARELSARPC